MALTDAKLRKCAKPSEKQFKLTDERGLYLLVKPNGGCYWRLDYRMSGKYCTLALGVYPEVTLKEARDRRDDARRQLRDGIDPAEERRERKRQAKAEAANSFEQVAREWHAQQADRWTDNHAHRVLRSLEKDVFPFIGHKPIAEITAPVLLQVLRRIEKRDALDYAGRVMQRINAVYRYAIATARVPYNPANDLAGSLKTRKVKHQAALTRPELPEFLSRLDEYSGDPETRLALRLIVLTFVRSRELREARWTEFDLKRAEWRIPAARMKMQSAHIVPLARQAVAILNELHSLTGRFELVFPGRKPTTPMSENTMLYAMYRMGYHSRATVHGFRATASTMLNEMGWRPDVIERQLAHAERNKVRAAYNRSEYLEERRAMMQAWADAVDGLAGRNVVPLQVAKEKV